MPYNFVADSFQTKKLCSRLFKRSAILDEKMTVLHFWSPIGGGGLGQRTMIILGSLESAYRTWTFLARCYGWGATSDYLFEIGDFAPTGAGWPKISGRRGHLQQPFFF